MFGMLSKWKCATRQQKIKEECFLHSLRAPNFPITKISHNNAAIFEVKKKQSVKDERTNTAKNNQRRR